MADILPNGKIQGHTGICPECKQETSVNMQGTPINHECEVKNLRIPVVIVPKDTVCRHRGDARINPQGTDIYCLDCGEKLE